MEEPMTFFDDSLKDANKLRKVARSALEHTTELEESKDAFASCMVAMFYMMDAIFHVLKVIEEKLPEKSED
jgi:hypothetical protein